MKRIAFSKIYGIMIYRYADLAQLVEQRIRNA